MNKSLFFFLFFIPLKPCFSQDSEEIEYKYAQGYYVDISGTKHIGQILIKNKKILFYANNSDKKEKIKLSTIDTLLLNGKRFLVIKNSEN